MFQFPIYDKLIQHFSYWGKQHLSDILYLQNFTLLASFKSFILTHTQDSIGKTIMSLGQSEHIDYTSFAYS